MFENFQSTRPRLYIIQNFSNIIKHPQTSLNYRITTNYKRVITSNASNLIVGERSHRTIRGNESGPTLRFFLRKIIRPVRACLDS